VLANVVTHTVENEENVEDDILFSTFRKLTKKKMTSSTSEVHVEGHEDEEEQHIETLDNFSELNIETLGAFEEWGTETPVILEK